jgi:hypothetical protein
MIVESIQTNQRIYNDKIVTTTYTTRMDETTDKRYITVATREITLYSRMGEVYTSNSKPAVDVYA